MKHFCPGFNDGSKKGVCSGEHTPCRKNKYNKLTYSGLNSLFGASHMGHTKESGKDSKSVPGAILSSGTPSAGSYIHPQTLQTYFFIIKIILILYSLTIKKKKGSKFG